jgi:diguanylate cyclase (GGDEF)-like protein
MPKAVFRYLNSLGAPDSRQDSGDQGRSEAMALMRVFEQSNKGWFWATDADGHLTYLSEQVREIVAPPDQNVLGCKFFDLFATADEDQTGRKGLPIVFARQAAFEKVMLRASGDHGARCWSASGCPQFAQNGQFIGYRGSAIDVTEYRASSEMASQLARYDPLTGLPNRRSMFDLLEAGIAASKHQDSPCAVMLVDLDRFKQVNDTLGHPIGDALLKQVADRMVTVVGEKERVFRLGGDEFQVILQDTPEDGLRATAQDIIHSLSQPYSVEGHRCVIGASVGVALAARNASAKEEVIRNADLALYEAKARGGQCVRFFSEALLKTAEDRRTIEEDLRDALLKRELTLAYQPIVDLQNNRVTGVEALVRWHHPRRGAVSPALFIPIAEETGLIEKLGEWALRQACADAVTWPGRLRVAVNVSPSQFRSSAFPTLVVSALANSGLAADRLELEITEGVFLGDSSRADLMFAALKKIGVRLALDDFGTGYSSLGYLRTAPFDKIKIDQSFVREATLPESRNSAIIAAIVALAGALGMETTAEGIEYMDQLDLVRNLKVSHAQGWIYSKALGTAALVQHLEAGNCVIEPVGPSTQRSDRQAVYRKIAVAHGLRYDDAILRNLSNSGALIDGLPPLAIGTMVLVNFGKGQVELARVTRVTGSQHGVAFEQPLVADAAGVLGPTRSVSPYQLHTSGLAEPSSSARHGELALPVEELAAKLGLFATPGPSQAERDVPATTDQMPALPTLADLAGRYIETLSGDEAECGRAKMDLRDHVLPRFGKLRLGQICQADIFTWLAAKLQVEGHPPGTDHRLHLLLSRMWGLAIQLKLPGAEPSPFTAQAWLDTSVHHTILAFADAYRVVEAGMASNNRQLRFILPLLMLTGARQSELLQATWDDLDLSEAVWRVPAVKGGEEVGREIRLSSAALDLLSCLPRWNRCSYLVPNPATKKPYHSISSSWEAVRSRIGLPYLEIDELRYVNFQNPEQQSEIVDLVRSAESE